MLRRSELAGFLLTRPRLLRQVKERPRRAVSLLPGYIERSHGTRVAPSGGGCRTNIGR